MLLYFTTKKISSICSTIKPEDVDVYTVKNITAIKKWSENDLLCKNYTLNALNDDLYDYYSSFETVKDIWDALQNKYYTKEVDSKKYAIGRCLRYRMLYYKSVISRVP